MDTIMTSKIYGLKNCDSMKKAFAWLQEHGVDYEFHDYRKSGVPRQSLVAWCRTLGWRTLVNTRGTTWRKLTPQQQQISSQSEAVALMLEYPSLIRRPLVETQNGQLLVGFDAAIFASFMQNGKK